MNVLVKYKIYRDPRWKSCGKIKDQFSTAVGCQVSKETKCIDFNIPGFIKFDLYWACLKNEFWTIKRFD